MMTLNLGSIIEQIEREYGPMCLSEVWQNLPDSQYTIQEAIIFVSQLMACELKLNSKTKSEELSEIHRKSAHQFFLEHKINTEYFQKCIKNLALSIGLAPPGSEQLRKCYVSRSILLFHLKLYDDCQKDIDRILSFKLNEDLKKKIAFRKVVVVKEHSNSIYEQAISVKIIMTSTKKPVPQCSISDFPVTEKIAYKYNKRWGKHVIATEEIKTGEVVAVEKPYSAVLEANHWYTNCWHCMTGCWSAIPCDHCVIAIYCSEKCKADSWKEYHDIECTIISYCIKLDISFLALRTVILAVKEMGSIEALTDLCKNLSATYDHIESCKNSINTKNLKNIYADVFNLPKLENNLKKKWKFHVTSSLITFVLATKTNYFQKVLPDDWTLLMKNEQFVFIAELISLHMLQQETNEMLYEEIFITNCRNKTYVASAIMPLFAQFNHSCDPNVFQLSANRCIYLIAAAPIKKGDQIFINYMNIKYTSFERDDRRTILKNNRYFDCKCRPCEENWIHLDFASRYSISLDKKTTKTVDILIENYDIVSLFLQQHEHKLSRDLIIKLSNILNNIHKLITIPCIEWNQIQTDFQNTFHCLGNLFYYPEPESTL